MGKNKKQIVTAEDPKKEEICQSDHILTPEAEVNSRKTTDIAKEILTSAPVPKV